MSSNALGAHSGRAAGRSMSMPPTRPAVAASATTANREGRARAYTSAVVTLNRRGPIRPDMTV
jgi:hypothetical protein